MKEIGTRKEEGQDEERRYGKGERKDRGRRKKGAMIKETGRRKEHGKDVGERTVEVEWKGGGRKRNGRRKSGSCLLTPS